MEWWGRKGVWIVVKSVSGFCFLLYSWVSTIQLFLFTNFIYQDLNIYIYSTSTKHCLPSKQNILTGVTARVDSKQMGLFENLAKYNQHYVKVKNARLLEEVPMSFELCMVSGNVLHTPPRVPS